MKTRYPAVAGMFYFMDPKHLRVQLDELFSGAAKRPLFRIVVSPHAGYEYSGRTAAKAIASLRPAKTFIILGPNHHGLGPAFSVYPSGEWQTPLGSVPVDSRVAAELAGLGFVDADEDAHAAEHSIEVQLPLLQHAFGTVSFVPVCIMNPGYSQELLDRCKALGSAIADIAGKGGVSVIASSDFSHYLPETLALEKDAAALDAILRLDADGFFSVLDEERASVCGFGPIAAAISAAKALGLKARPIASSTSGDVTGDRSSVVSYKAIGFG